MARYQSLLDAAAKIDAKQRKWYDKLCWWSDVTTKQGADIFVLAPRGPGGQADTRIDIWEFVAYCASKMHDRVVVDGKKFAIVWVQLNNHRFWPWGVRWLLEGVHPNYYKHVEGLHILHPSWGVRFLRLALWPIAEDAFWDRFHAHERIEFLETAIDMKVFRLPKDLYAYDENLDKQAKEMQAEAAKKFGTGGFGGPGMGAPEQDPKMQEQMDSYQKLLEQRGFGKEAKMD